MKTGRIISAIALLCALASVSAQAEIFRGIMPDSSLADIKELFPQAQFSEVHPAWTKDYEVLYEVTGQGLSGTMIIKMTDTSVRWKKRLEEDPPESEQVRSILEELAVSSDKTFISDWIRWIPDTPIPIERVVGKYGPAEKSGYAEDDFSPYKSWPSKGVRAVLSDDGKSALSFEYSFTIAEWCSVHTAFPPEECKKKEKPKSTPKAATKQKAK